MRRNEIILLAKKAADAWRNTDTYHQAAQIIDMLISELEGDPTLPPPNEPLTLEELREMDGEPVYLIVDDQYEPLKMWALIEVVETANCVILTSNLGGRNEYYDNDEMKDDGVTAYRRPPEGEA